MNARKKRIAEIERAVGSARLVFFGTRGADAELLIEIRQFDRIFSQVAPLHALSIEETCLEALTKQRVDLDRYNIDDDRRPVVSKIRGQLLRAFDSPCCVVAYRPCAMLASAWFPRSDRVRYLGLFHEKQSCFEHKPWVERQLADVGIQVLPWSYYADEESHILLESSRAQALVLRTNRTDGGAGVELVRDPRDLKSRWPRHTDGFLAVAPFLTPSTSLNVNACVFQNGQVSLHGPSVQLIGLRSATTRRFGYCGNDFCRVEEIDGKLVDQLEDIVVRTGKWLHKNGYLGAFGVDSLIYRGKIYLTEVNPRFQGSSLLSAVIDQQLDRPDVFLNHIAAFLGLSVPAPVRLRDLVRRQPPLAHVICHNIRPKKVRAKATVPDSLEVRCRLVPASDVEILPEAITFEAVFEEAVTDDGTQLLAPIERAVRRAAQGLYGDGT
jgi:hypothetical protein